MLGEFCRGCAIEGEMTVWQVCSLRPIGGCREACGAWPGFEPTGRAKLAARAGLAAAGDLAGLRRWLEIGRGCGKAGDLAGLRRWPEIWRVTANTGKQTGARMRKNRRPEGRRLSVRHGGLEPSTR